VQEIRLGFICPLITAADVNRAKKKGDVPALDFIRKKLSGAIPTTLKFTAATPTL
jgi:hypothetical protein